MKVSLENMFEYELTASHLTLKIQHFCFYCRCAKNNGGCDQKCNNSPGGYGCSCTTGYELFTANGTAGYTIEKSENGLRDGDTLQLNKSCVPVMCPQLESPENGLILSTKKQYHFGDLVKIQCNFGYVMSGSSALLCLSSGQWNGTVPECTCKLNTFTIKAFSETLIEKLSLFFSICRCKMCLIT